MAGLSARSVILICMLKCVSLDSKKLLTCHYIALCKTPKFSSSPSSNTAPPFGARICAACQGSAV